MTCFIALLIHYQLKYVILEGFLKTRLLGAAVPVEVRFLRTTYRVPEGVGVVEVCVSGTFYRESVSVVNITLSAATMDNSTSPARCKKHGCMVSLV